VIRNHVIDDLMTRGANCVGQESSDRPRERAGQGVRLGEHLKTLLDAYPGAGLVAALVAGCLLGWWVKRR
jgi:hypothetical protein